MRNMSIADIISAFRANPDRVYQSPKTPLHFNNFFLFSGINPIAMFDPVIGYFVCLDAPLTPSNITRNHLTEFHYQNPSAVRLPKLDATKEETAAYYDSMLEKIPETVRDSDNVYDLIRKRKQIAMDYFTRANSDVYREKKADTQNQLSAHQIPLSGKITSTKYQSFEQLILAWVKDPAAYHTHRMLTSPLDKPLLKYRGTTLAIAVPNPIPNPTLNKADAIERDKTLYLVRRYDKRYWANEFTSLIKLHLDGENKLYLFVPECDVPLADTPTSPLAINLAAHVSRFNIALATIASEAMEYRYESKASRALGQAFAHIWADRQKFMDFFSISPTTNPLYIPDEETRLHLNKLSAHIPKAADAAEQTSVAAPLE